MVHFTGRHCRILTSHQKQDLEAQGFVIPIYEPIVVVQHLLTLRDSSSGEDFPGFPERIHWPPDTEASGPMSCTTKAPVVTQAVTGRSQERIGGTTMPLFENHAVFLGLGGDARTPVGEPSGHLSFPIYTEKLVPGINTCRAWATDRHNY